MVVQMIREKGGSGVKLSQGNWVGRALGYLPALAAQVTQTLYRTVPYHTIQYHTVPYSTIPYHTVPDHILAYPTMPNISR